MKKRILLIILSICLLFPLFSCKREEEDPILGVWLLGDKLQIDDTFHTVFEIEELRLAYNVVYYVDGYTSDKIVDHFNGKIPYQKSITIYSDTKAEDYLKIVLVCKNGDNYYLKDRNNGYPMVFKDTVKYDFKIEDYLITIIYHYVEKDDE